MGGSNKTTQKTNEKSTQQQTAATTGTNSTNYNNSTTNSPYGPSTGLLNSILQQAGAVSPTNFGNTASDITSLIPGLLSGYNPATEAITNAATYGAQNAASSNAAAAGRDLTSPGYAASVGGNIARTLAPYMYQNYQQGLSQVPGLLSSAAGIPFAGLSNLENLILPIAGQFGKTSSTGTQSGTNTGNTNIRGFGTNVGTTTTTLPQNPLQVGLGGALGVLGLLSQGASGGLGGSLGSMLGGLL